MSTFREAVAGVQPLLVGARHEAFMTDPDRLEEAEHVEPCVIRAVYGELDPTGHRAVGRPTKLSPPGLGEYLAARGRYRPDDPVAAAAIADATRSVMALGWLFSCTPEAVVADRSARDIWDFWAGPSLRDPLDQIVPKKLARLIHERGAEMLVGKLKDAGLKRRRPSMVRQIGWQIVQHGFYLRMVQSVEIDETWFREAVSARRSSGLGTAGGRWEWGAYPDVEPGTPLPFSNKPERAPIQEWSERQLTENIPECYVGNRDRPHVRAAVVLHQDLDLLPWDIEDETRREALEQGEPFERFAEWAIFLLDFDDEDRVGLYMDHDVSCLVRGWETAFSQSDAAATAQAWINDVGDEAARLDFRWLPGVYQAATVAFIKGTRPMADQLSFAWVMPPTNGYHPLRHYPPRIPEGQRDSASVEVGWVLVPEHAVKALYAERGW